MPNHDAPHKNPARVPMTLQAMDDPTAHHEPAHILGREGTMPRKTIEKTGIYRDKQGNQFFMAAGDETTRDVEFSHERGGKPDAPAQKRKKGPAPENKAKAAAPENRARKAED